MSHTKLTKQHRLKKKYNTRSLMTFGENRLCGLELVKHLILIKSLTSVLFLNRVCVCKWVKNVLVGSIFEDLFTYLEI